MRISNNQLFYRALNGMLGLQEDIQTYQTQVSSGKR